MNQGVLRRSCAAGLAPLNFLGSCFGLECSTTLSLFLLLFVLCLLFHWACFGN